MKKLLALILTVSLLLGLVSVHAEEPAKYERLNVGTFTAFSGNFFSEALGNNSSDQDVRRLIHGYSLVYWDEDTESYQFDSRIVSAVSVSADELTYTIVLADGLTYNDGTPITANDYVFSLLLQGSPELEEAAGSRANLRQISGGTAYGAGETEWLSGVKLMNDLQFSVTLEPAYASYFYQLKVLDVTPPLPISVIAPGCSIESNANKGVAISGPFSAAELKKTLMDPETGYVSHPAVSGGAYSLAEYDGTSVRLVANERYIGNKEGRMPQIAEIVYRAVDADEAIGLLASGDLDLVTRCARASQTDAGRQLAATEEFAMSAYSRPGLSFISFCADAGLTEDVSVRRAIAMCMDKEGLTEDYLGAFGTPVNGFYGIGQWMFQMANGSMVPEEGQEQEWEDLKIEVIPETVLNTEEADEILNAAGWHLTKNATVFETGSGDVRCKLINGEIVPLSLKLVYPEGNGAADLLQEYFADHLNEIGIELTVEAKPVKDLLEMYYGYAERDCDMILLGTNFNDAFDPSGEFDENGTNILTGITDEELALLAVRLRETPPGHATEFCRRWLAYEARRSEIVSEIPLYSGAYLDFYTSSLYNYEPGKKGSWAFAVQDAFLSDYVPEEETTELSEGEEIFE